MLVYRFTDCVVCLWKLNLANTEQGTPLQESDNKENWTVVKMLRYGWALLHG